MSHSESEISEIAQNSQSSAGLAEPDHFVSSSRLCTCSAVPASAMDVEVISVEDENDDSDEEGALEEIFSQEPHEEGHRPQDISAAATTAVAVDLTGPAREPDALTFEEEYDGLLRSARGFGFPFEAVAELLLRRPEHWWCRYSKRKGTSVGETLSSERQRGIGRNRDRATQRRLDDGRRWAARICLYWLGIVLGGVVSSEPPHSAGAD